MLADLALIAAAFALLLISAELFTNGIEWLGQRLQLSEGVVGSVLAAVGTAMPETLIPFVAVFFFQAKHGQEVGIGAIAGAPFMLATLTLAVCGIAMWMFAKRGRRPEQLSINKVVLARDLRFFIFTYSIALATSFTPPLPLIRYLLAAVLLLIYPYYVYKTFKHEGEMGQEPEQLHFDRLFKTGSNRLRIILPQTLLGLAGILGGAFLFVDNVQDFATTIGVPVLVLSLIITPVATELPEKINSITWARSGKDTLALGNITGALVFQASFPVAFGVAFTNWQLDLPTVLTGVAAILSAAYHLRLINLDRLSSTELMKSGILYIAAIAFLIYYKAAVH